MKITKWRDGHVGLLMVGRLKSTVAKWRFSGHDVRLWLSGGILFKSYRIEGDPKAVDGIIEELAGNHTNK